ncbi:hypothetical protein BsWGS_09546 [Bradybaena similaris]
MWQKLYPGQQSKPSCIPLPDSNVAKVIPRSAVQAKLYSTPRQQCGRSYTQVSCPSQAVFHSQTAMWQKLYSGQLSKPSCIPLPDSNVAEIIPMSTVQAKLISTTRQQCGRSYTQVSCPSQAVFHLRQLQCHWSRQK